jgi:hypothetical protein
MQYIDAGIYDKYLSADMSTPADIAQINFAKSVGYRLPAHFCGALFWHLLAITLAKH